MGSGYAGLFFAHQLIKNRKSFVLCTSGEKSASQVSAGIINPVVLKRFTAFWKAQEQIDFLKSTLKEIESYTGKNFFVNEPVHRIFHDENEKHLWLKKSASETLSSFLSPDFEHLPALENPYDSGKVMQSGRLNVASFFNEMHQFLKNNGFLKVEWFDYQRIDTGQKIYNGGIHFGKIIFAEGIGVRNNPFFKNIEIHPNKGHHLEVNIPGLSVSKTVKKKHFLFPLNDAKFYYGGTYDRESTSGGIDESAVQQLENGLREIVPEGFQTLNAYSGFRPTVKDRRPILGRHEEFGDFYVFNGLGARGILNGSYFSKCLFDFAENNVALPPEVDIARFRS